MAKLLVLSLIGSVALTSACKKDHPPTTPASPAVASASVPAVAAPVDASRLAIKITEKGFEPADVNVPAGKPVTLVFERTTDETCAKQVIMTLDDGQKIEKSLPLNTPVEIAATFSKLGKLTYACGMDMMHGSITVQ
jgi:plastocyanin domain-containing protein